MSFSKCLFFVSLVCQNLAVALGEGHCPRGVGSLTLRLVQDALIVVPLEINHSGPYEFVVDTGAQVTTIEPSLATELGVKIQGTTTVSGVETYARTAYSNLDLLGAGEYSVPNAIAVIQEMAQFKAADPRIRGILAANFIEHFDVLIDNGGKFMCLDKSGALAAAIKGERVELVEPRGSQTDLPFTEPILVSARLSGFESQPVLLRLDSGSNAPLLYAYNSRLHHETNDRKPALTRFVNGVEQSFAVLAPQEVHIGKVSLRHLSFVIPMSAAVARPQPREDGLLPTIAFQRVFISCSRGYVTLEPWEH